MLTLLPAAPQAAAAEITISTAAELEAFRDSVNSGKDYSGVTVKLTADIELGGAWDEQWTPHTRTQAARIILPLRASLTAAGTQ